MARDLVSSLTVPILLGHPPRGAIVVFTSRHSVGCARSDYAEKLGSNPRRALGTEVPETTGILLPRCQGNRHARARHRRRRATVAEVVVFQLFGGRKTLRGPRRVAVYCVFTRPAGKSYPTCRGLEQEADQEGGQPEKGEEAEDVGEG